MKDEYENSDRYESLSNRRFSKHKVFSSNDLNKPNNRLHKTNKSKNKINKENDNEEAEEKDQVNDLFPIRNNNNNNKNAEKTNKIYKKINSQGYKTVNDDEQFDFDDLREFINSKIRKSSKRPVVRPGHHRSNSTNLYNY